mmetsp:Transcript_11715/g.17877  ORF Transcript_11715/g.17877 Transcript_11715/m.17877 type:complete len:458 (-) Transcript_11715:730-2103(-)
MGLHTEGLLGFGKDFEQLVVGQEVEPGEEASLGLEVVVETLLDAFQLLVGSLENLAELLNLYDSEGCGVVIDAVHEVVPGDVDFLELGAFDGHLVDDILRREDGLEVQPDGLHLQPEVEVLLGSHQHGLPLHDLLQHELSEGRALHGLRLDNVVVECSLDEFNCLTTEDEGVFALGFDACELERSPLILHLEHGPLVAELLGGLVTDLLEGVTEVLDLELLEELELHVLKLVALLHSRLDQLEDHVNVALLQAGVAQSTDDWDELLELLELFLDLQRDALGLVQFVLLESDRQFVGKTVHLLKVSFDLIGLEILQRALDPHLLLLDGLHLKVPELIVGLDLNFQLVDQGILANHEVKVLLLVVDVLQLFSDVLELAGDFINLFAVLLGLTSGVVVFEAVHGGLHFLDFSLEVPSLLNERVLDVNSLLLELLLTGLNDLDDLVDVVVSEGHGLDVVFN